MRGVISFDLDGVLANFTRGFTRIAYEKFGTPVGDANSQQNWMFEDFPELGLDKAQCKWGPEGPIWGEIFKSPDFWATLDPLNVSVMRRINKIRNKVFITNRVGVNPLWQSEMFLKAWGVWEPSVIVAEKKAPVAIEQRVVAHIDDYYKNCVELQEQGPQPCYIALAYCPYNKVHHEEWVARGGEIVLSVDHFINECEKRGLIEY